MIKIVNLMLCNFEKLHRPVKFPDEGYVGLRKRKMILQIPT